MPNRQLETVGLGIDLSKNFIRGAARLLVAELTNAFPAQLDDVVKMDTTSTSEVQTITITGTPTGGTFTLSFKGYTTTPLVYNAIGSAVQTALGLLASVGPGALTVTGSAGGPYVITAALNLAAQALPLITATASLTGGTTPAIGVVRTTPGFGQFDAQPGWLDLGPTKGGITVLRNNAEETFDVDQLLADIYSMPTSWQMTVQAAMAAPDLDLLQYLWEGGQIVLDTDTGERFLPLGAPTSYRRKRLAVMFQRQSFDGGVTPGGVQGYCFRIAQRTPQESTVVFNKTGDQATVPFTWNALQDPTITDPHAAFGGILDQL